MAIDEAKSPCTARRPAPGCAKISGHTTIVQAEHEASSSENLCAQSFADVGSPLPLNLCTGGDFDQIIPIASGRWFEVGLRNKFNAPIGISSANANNVNLVAAPSASTTLPFPPQASPAKSRRGSRILPIKPNLQVF